MSGSLRAGGDGARPGGVLRPSMGVVGNRLGGAGSVASVARLQATLLSDAWDIVVVSDGEPGAVPGVGWIAVATPNLRLLRRLAHVPREWLAARRLARAVAELHERRPLSAVLVQSHSLAAALAPGLRRRRVPLVLVVHGDIRDRPAGTYDRRVTAFYRWATPRAYRAADLVLVGSEAFARRVRPDVRSGVEVAVLPSPVVAGDLGPLAHREAAQGRGPVRVAYVGRLAVEKGPLVLLAAARSIWREGGELTLTFVGDGPLWASLQAEAAQEVAQGRVRLVGWQDRSTLGRWMTEADLVCVPSLSEPQGLVAVEAELCGVPVVASRTGGLVDAVREGVDGELAEPGDVEDLAAALRRATQGVLESRYRVPDPEWLSRYAPEVYGERLAGRLAALAEAGGPR